MGGSSYMNRGGGGGPPQFDLGSKLNNLNLDHSMKLMNRQSGPGQPI
jgi:hypothetical protein